MAGKDKSEKELTSTKIILDLMSENLQKDYILTISKGFEQ